MASRSSASPSLASPARKSASEWSIIPIARDTGDRSASWCRARAIAASAATRSPFSMSAYPTLFSALARCVGSPASSNAATAPA